ncbi:MAG: hypothetical protein HYZ44_03450 [Bacteroidetes bacterium]|nr:hypothetical protein [Bacteroidota bacterium]
MEYTRIDGIDIEIQIAFKSAHLPLLIPYFEKAGIHSQKVNSIIDEYILTGEHVVFERWFLDSCQKRLNPEMNSYLKRDVNYPTFNRLLKVALKERIEQDPTVLHLRKSKGLGKAAPK